MKKITRAMEKVAAVKMRRSVARTLAAREYAFHTYELLSSLLSHTHLKHSYFKQVKSDRVLILAISSNRGLCGNLNTQLSRVTTDFLESHKSYKCEVVAVGKKMELLARRNSLPLLASFTNLPDVVTARDVLPLVKLVSDEFLKGNYKKIMVVYNHFSSALKFTPMVRQILPLNKHEIEQVINTIFKQRERVGNDKFMEYTFEPGEETVLDFVLPRMLEVKLYKMILESRACEQSARMMAMKNASENAERLIDDLAVSYNRARQDGITRELSEIAAGAGALTY